jgi:hypothetical protein
MPQPAPARRGVSHLRPGILLVNDHPIPCYNPSFILLGREKPFGSVTTFHEQPLSPLSSRRERPVPACRGSGGRDLRCALRVPHIYRSASTLSFVIPGEADLSRLSRRAAERSAVPRTFPGNSYMFLPQYIAIIEGVDAPVERLQIRQKNR